MPKPLATPGTDKSLPGGKVYPPGKFNIGDDAQSLDAGKYREGQTYGLNPDTEVDKLTVAPEVTKS